MAGRLRPCLFACLLVLALVQAASAEAPPEVVEEELTDEQLQYYREIFQQYDEDADQKISMEENLAQDKIIADQQEKPFDEVAACSHESLVDAPWSPACRGN